MITSEISSTEVVSEMLVAAVTAADPVTATCRPSRAQCDRQPAAVVPLRGIRPGPADVAHHRERGTSGNIVSGSVTLPSLDRRGDRDDVVVVVAEVAVQQLAPQLAGRYTYCDENGWPDYPGRTGSCWRPGYASALEGRGGWVAAAGGGPMAWACEPVAQGRSLLGLSIAQMRVIWPPAASNAYTATVTLSC